MISKNKVITLLGLTAFLSSSVSGVLIHDRWSIYWEDQESLAQIHPTVKVQASLAEGIGWEGTGPASQTANHIVITVAGSDPKIKSPIPYANRPIWIKATSEVACIIEDGANLFKDCSMDPNKEHTFQTNALGRVSFSIPVDEQLKKHSSGSVFPTLLIRTGYMTSQQWVVVHMDNDVHHSLGKVTPSDLMAINSNLTTSVAEQVSKAIVFLSSLSKSYKVDRSLTKRNVDSIFTYDPTRNLVHSYLVQNDKGPLDKRYLVPKTYQHEVFLESQSAWWKSHESLQKRSFNIASKDDERKWATLYGRDVSSVVDDGRHGVIYSIFKTVEDVWNALLSVLRRVGISIKKLFDHIRTAFSFDDILRTNQFLGTFYRLLAPLGIRGMELIKRDYKEAFTNMTDNSQALFEDVISSLGGKDLTLETMRENAAHNADLVMRKGNISNENQIDTSGVRGPLDADAKTHFLHDRIVNNLDSAIMELNNSTMWSRIQKLAEDAAAAIAGVVSADAMKAIHMHTLKFVSTTNIASISLAQILNFLRSVTIFSEQVSGKLLEAILNILPLYWNLAIGFMLLPLKIPFLYHFWTKKLTKGTSDFTILDMLTLAGSVYGTWSYKMFNSNKAPFTDADIAVFKKVTQPELFLYTWNHDPTTYAMDSPQLQRHRLGIYDWIPRLQMTVVVALQILSFDLTMAVGSGSTGNPGELTRVPQVFSAIIGILGRIGGYPLTQLQNNDPVVVKNSMMHPDSRFLGFWAWWIVEDVVRVVRFPFSGMNKYPYLANLNLVIVGFPLSYYGIRVIRDTGKNIAHDDWPRRAVLSTMWVEAGMLYLDILLPYFESYSKRGKVGVAVEAIEKFMRLAKYGRDGVVLTMHFSRNALMIGNHIVGMLSSSFQGEAGTGDGKRPDL